MEEGIDDITPFLCIGDLPVRPQGDLLIIRSRKGQGFQGFCQLCSLLSSFKMIILEPLDQGPAILHAEIVGQAVKEQLQQIRTG